MNKRILAVAGSVAALSMIAVLPVFAQEGEGMMKGPRGPMSARALPGVIGTDHVERRMGTSTRPLPSRPMMLQNESEGKVRGAAAIGGKVSAVGSASFTLEVPKMRDAATTTVTVNTSASTTYMLGRSPAAFADIATGNYVMAMGAFSTSTKTLSAVRVQIATTSPMAGPGMMKPGAGFNADGQGREAHMWGNASSSAPERIKNLVSSIMQGFTNFFHRGR